ncbi:MAG: hybrid sensor histidine kinase/response regulator [Myxococcota bacterium]
MPESFHILAVDDEPRGVELLDRCLRGLGTVFTATSGEEAWARAEAGGFDLIVSDQRMPGCSGVELLTRVAEQQPGVGRILITGYTDLESTIEAINRGRVHAYLTKPCSPGELELTARSVLERVQLSRDNERLVANLSQKNQELEAALASLAETQRRMVDSERLAAIGRLVAMVVHDFRTPLSLVRSAASELVHDGGHEPELREDLAREVLAEVDRLQRMCDELLEATRMGEGRARPQDEALDEVVESALARIVEDASRCGIEVVTDLASGARMPIDENRLRRALLNLWTNALEAMPEGGRLRVASGREEGSVWLCVEDTGVGIPEEIRETLFEPFVSAGKARGTGLGLAIVKKVVEDHGGSIEVAKPEGGGTAFHLRFRLS